MADDDSIFVDIVPRLSDSETEKATQRLRDKFKDGARGAGKAISDVLHSELSQELGRSLEPVARDAGTRLAKELGSAAGDLLHSELSGALQGVGVDFDGVIDKAKDLAKEFDPFIKSLKDITQGDTTSKLQGVADILGQLEKNGIDTHGAAGHAPSTFAATMRSHLVGSVTIGNATLCASSASGVPPPAR